MRRRGRTDERVKAKGIAGDNLILTKTTFLQQEYFMKFNALTNQIVYTIDEMKIISNMLKNIRTRSKNANTVDNTIAVNELADLMGLKLPEEQ